MFKNLRWNKLLLFLPLMALIFCFNTSKTDDEKMQTIMMSTRRSLMYLHYSPKDINDDYSKGVYDKYMEMMDPGKRFFLKSDIREFETYKLRLDDYFFDEDLSFYKLSVDRLYQRVDEADKITKEIFKTPLNFNEDETYVLDEKKKEFPKDHKEFQNEWKKYIKLNILQEMETLTAREEAQQKKKDSVIANKLLDTINVKKLTSEEKLTKATNEVKDYMSQYFNRFKKRKKMDWFTMYMNAYTETFDPHTNYFSPKNKEDFDINFKGKFYGIGAVIQEKKGHLYLGELSIGAPAWKSKQLSAGDKILKVKSKPNSENVNVSGMLVDEVVRYIRGEKGVPVILTVEKRDKSIREVTLVREEVTIEDTFARSLVINGKNGKKYGFIYLPSFNADFENKNARNASDDVKAEILKLKKQNISGLILDLRNNGGGSLSEVGDIMGLFMKSGAYVQIKDGTGKTQTYHNKSGEPIWNGSLLIMQNELSASASEILAGEMQDYGRAVVLGSPQSFGKGTVQTFVDLNRFLNTDEDFGSLKVTIQKFYRITGESTQRKGIQSDIVMKDFFSYAEVGERYDEYALPWDKIAPTVFQKVNKVDVQKLKQNADKRIANNKTYQLLLESAQWKEKLDKNESITLNQAKFEKLMKERKQQIERFKALDKFRNGLTFVIHPDEVLREKKDEAFKKKTENWLKNLQRDVYLQEAMNIVQEM